MVTIPPKKSMVMTGGWLMALSWMGTNPLVAINGIRCLFHQNGIQNMYQRIDCQRIKNIYLYKCYILNGIS